MVQSLIELGHFGGWSDRGEVDVTASAVVWGDPMYRNLEITPIDDTVNGGNLLLRLPDSARATVGAEYSIFVWWEDAATHGPLEVQDFSGVTIVKSDASDLIITPSTEGEGECVTLIFDGTAWRMVSPQTFGYPDKTMRYKGPVSGGDWPLLFEEVGIYQNTANMDALAIATSNGYGGEDNYRLVIRCESIVVGSSSQSLPAFTTGDGWGSGCSVHLKLINSTVAGWGGDGAGSNGFSEEVPTDGGDALVAYTNLVVFADVSSAVTAGGGGGSTNSVASHGAGGGNGGNMTAGGAITGSEGGVVSYDPGPTNLNNGSPGFLTLGGATGGSPADAGADWGGDGVAGGTYTTNGGKIAQAESPHTITWSAPDGFRWGDSGSVGTAPSFPTTEAI